MVDVDKHDRDVRVPGAIACDFLDHYAAHIKKVDDRWHAIELRGHYIEAMCWVIAAFAHESSGVDISFLRDEDKIRRIRELSKIVKPAYYKMIDQVRKEETCPTKQIDCWGTGTTNPSPTETETS